MVPGERPPYHAPPAAWVRPGDPVADLNLAGVCLAFLAEATDALRAAGLLPTLEPDGACFVATPTPVKHITMGPTA